MDENKTPEEIINDNAAPDAPETDAPEACAPVSYTHLRAHET